MTDKAVNRLRVAFWLSGIIFLWMGSAFFLMMVLSHRPLKGTTPPSVGDLATIFFGASSLALIIFSLLTAIAAIIEWKSIKSDIKEVIDAAKTTQEKSAELLAENEERTNTLLETMQTRITNLEEKIEKRVLEMRGRVNTIMGLSIGTVHSDPFEKEQTELDKLYLAEAIHFCEKGYETLQEVEGNGKYMALNNIVYYSCLLGVDSERDQLLAQGRELREVSLKYKESPWTIAYLLTFCRVVWKYGTDPSELRQAFFVAESVLERQLTKLQRKEAALLAASLEERLREFDPVTG